MHPNSKVKNRQIVNYWIKKFRRLDSQIKIAYIFAIVHDI